MFSFINRTVFDIPLTWNRHRFEDARLKCRTARRLITTSVNGVQFEKQLRVFLRRNSEVEETIAETNEQLSKHAKKVQMFDHFADIASQSLSDHVDQRMENVRAIIQEHCQAIQKVLHEETEYWKELHSAINREVITSKDIHRRVSNTQSGNDEQCRSELLNNRSSTSGEVDLSSLAEKCTRTKQERVTAVSSIPKPNRIPTSINKTYFVKLEETINSSTSVESPPSHQIPMEVDSSPMYSQPNLPAQLCFSPTLLQDEGSESIKHVLSPLDQNQILRPRVILHRVDQTFLLDHLKREKMNGIDNHDLHVRLTENSNPNESNVQNLFAVPDLPSKCRSRVKIKTETESVVLTKTTRKRKQSVLEDADPTLQTTTIALRKRKVLSIIESDEKKPKSKPAKRRKKKKTKESTIAIREPSPLPSIDQSKHYSTRLSTCTHRSHSLTRSMVNMESDNEYEESQFRSRSRKKQNDDRTKKVAKSIKSKRS